MKLTDKYWLEGNGFYEFHGQFHNKLWNITIIEERGKWYAHLNRQGHTFFASGYATARNAYKALMRIYTTKLQEGVKNVH